MILHCTSFGGKRPNFVGRQYSLSGPSPVNPREVASTLLIKLCYWKSYQETKIVLSFQMATLANDSIPAPV